MNQHYDVLLLDPPRSGAYAFLSNFITINKVSKIVMISCDASSLLEMLNTEECGYQLDKLLLADQFPQTSHVECMGVFLLAS